MTTLPPDPFAPGGITAFARRLRSGETTCEAAIEACLARIAVLDPKLGAFEHVMGEQALATARALDRLLAAGTDLGPLMGVPVAVKDIFAVEGAPTHAGSNLDVAAAIGAEGSFVKALRRAGCVILGKTKTVEFALGAVGISQSRGTPWNPCDASVQRIPGGSSSGSAVATAAGLAAFGIGSDTGGSVRLPATFNGIFGLKTTVGRFATDGVFPLSPELDSIGPLTRSAADAALVYSALTGEPVPAPAAPKGLRLGRPTNYFFDKLDPEVADCTEAVISRLEVAGVEIVPIEVPEAGERERFFPAVLPANLIAVLGRERFQAEREKIDPVVRARGDRGLQVMADEYLRLEWRRRELCRIGEERMRGLDGWVSATAALLPPPVADFEDPKAGLAMALAITQNAQPGNLFGFSGTSTPVQSLGAPLPVGFQVLCPAFAETRALSIALLLEELIGEPALPGLGGFL